MTVNGFVDDEEVEVLVWRLNVCKSSQRLEKISNNVRQNSGDVAEVKKQVERLKVSLEIIREDLFKYRRK